MRRVDLETVAAPRATAAELARRTVQRRAVEAAIWGMPMVSVDAMREAFFRDAGARYNDIVFWSMPSDWKNQLTTPNASSLYVYFNVNTRDGPVVLELPAAAGAGLFGTLLDAWQVPLMDVGPKGEDGGRGGKYLLLPPGFAGEVPAGYIPVRTATYNAYGLFRAIPVTSAEAETRQAIALVKKQRLYPLAEAAAPPEQRFIDVADRLFDGIVRYDESLYARLARMVQEEPVQRCDLVAMGELRSLGIEKGRPFSPDGPTQAALAAGAREAHEWLVREQLDGVLPWWTGGHWGVSRAAVLATKTTFRFQTADRLDVDARASIYSMAFAPAARPEEATFHLVAYRDAEGDPLDGGSRYRLRIPFGVPARQFWAVTAYDLETAGFIRDSPRVGVDSYDPAIRRNTDGSIDVSFGPEPAAGHESNWVYTPPGTDWFAMFRFYGPQKPLIDRTWALPDLARR